MKKIIKVFFVIILLGIFVYCIYNITKYLSNSKKNEKLTDELKNIAVKEITQDKKAENNEIPIDVDFDKLNENNDNIKAWIYMEDSIINYPIIKGNDNSFYLNHSIDGKYNPNGSLFIDFRNSDNFENMVTYIYGHHMKNNTMFGNLEFFKDQEYYDKHKEMYLFTKDINYKIEIFAGFTTADGSKIYNYIGSNSNDEIVKYAKNNSNFKANVDISSKDKIIVLSTCSYDYENARYVLFGKLRNIK